MVKQWLVNEEEKAMKQIIEEIETYYGEKRNISWKDVRKSKALLEKYQLIHVLGRKGSVVVSVSLLPSAAPKELQMDGRAGNPESRVEKGEKRWNIFTKERRCRKKIFSTWLKNFANAA
jgi:hypothetical protein